MGARVWQGHGAPAPEIQGWGTVNADRLRMDENVTRFLQAFFAEGKLTAKAGASA